MKDKRILRELSRYQLGTFADIVYRNALLNPEREAFVCGTERVTFQTFNSRVNNLVYGLTKLGLRKGDVVGILSWNCLEYADVYGAAMKGGFIASPFNPRMHPDELEYLINYSEAKALFVGPEWVKNINILRPRIPGVKNFISFETHVPDMVAHHEMLGANRSEEPNIQVKKDDPFLIFYTSGTTGVPRGALYTHDRKMDNTRIKALELGAAPDDKHLLILPMFHIGGDSHVWPFFYVGACNVIMEQKSFDPDATLQIIQDEKLTDVQIVPTQLVAMLARSNFDAYDLGSLKRIWYAASPMPMELLRKGLEALGPVFAQGYGQTESGPQVAFLPRKAHEVLNRPVEEQKILRSCGQPSIGVHMRIVDENNNDVEPAVIGEIVVQSNSIMVEYWKKPEDTSEVIIDGWLHTGDMGYYDERGYVYIVDRKKDMIVTGGENIYPREVEEVLYGHPAIAEAAVVGISDPVWVERVHAEIILKEGAVSTRNDVIAFCKEHMASYKAPKSVAFVKSLPKNPQGKILKKEIRSKYRKQKMPDL